MNTFTLDLRQKDGGYRVRSFGRLWPSQLRDRLSVVGTESEEYLASLAQARPDTIYFVTEEALV